MEKLTKIKKPIIVAIDGVSASGKGSVAKLIAKEFKLAYLETGLLYRALGCFVIEAQLSIDQVDEIVKIAHDIEIKNIQTLNLHNEIVATAAASVAKIKEVREALLFKQRDFANNPPNNKSGTILDGRDIGTVVCSNANIKFFLTASLEVRAQRRYKQLHKDGSKITLEEISNAIKARDESDKKLNDLAFNNKDYIIIDNSKLTLQQTFILLRDHIVNELKIAVKPIK